jgi:hypothetical protein
LTGSFAAIRPDLHGGGKFGHGCQSARRPGFGEVLMAAGLFSAAFVAMRAFATVASAWP